MNRIYIIIALAILLSACNRKNADEAATGKAIKVPEGSGTEYVLTAENSTVQWRGTKPAGEHTGSVEIENGLITYDGNITGGRIIIDLNSIKNEDLKGDMNKRLVDHLKSEDFFHTEQYPDAIFEIVSVEQFTGNASEKEITPTHMVTGNLSMRGQKKSIRFPAEIAINDDKISVRTNEFSVDRTEWGVNFKSRSVFDELKDDYISDQINLKFDVVFSET